MYLNTVFKYNVFKYCPALVNDANSISFPMVHKSPFLWMKFDPLSRATVNACFISLVATFIIIDEDN